MHVLNDIDKPAGVELAAAEWDAFLEGRRGVDIQQTSAWGRLKVPADNIERVTISRADGTIVAGAQMLIRTFGRMVNVGYVPFGPVASSDSDALEVIDGLERVGRERGLVALLVHPARSAAGEGVPMSQSLLRCGYREASTQVAASATVDLALTGTIDDIRRGYNKSRRKNLKKARKAGVEIRHCGPEGTALFHALHVESAKRNGFSPMSLEYIQRQGDELGVGRGIEIVAAVLDGEPVAAGLFTVCNGRIEFKMTGWNPTPRSSQACVNDAIQDYMVEWALAAGLDVFDLGGLPRHHAELLIDPDVDHGQFAGTGTAFKTAWGGRVRIDEPTFEKVLRPVGHVAYRIPSSLLADDGFGGRIVNWLRRS